MGFNLAFEGLMDML